MPQNRAFFPGNALFQFLVYNESSQRCFSDVIVFQHLFQSTSPRPRSPGPRHEDPPGTRGEKGGEVWQRDRRLSEQVASDAVAPKPTKYRAERQRVPALRPSDENASGAGEVSEHVSVHRTNMVGHEAAAQEGDRYDRAAPFSTGAPKLCLRGGWAGSSADITITTG